MRTAAFHNTVDARGQLLLDFEAQCRGQEAEVLEMFERVRQPMAYFEVAKLLPRMNEVSLKRALSNLTKDRKTKKGVVTRKAKLVKTAVQVMGPEAVNCYRYALIAITTK